MATQPSVIELDARVSSERRLSRDQDGSPVGQVDGSSAETQAPLREFSLPPVDGGKDAWFFLAACFVMEALVWGFPFAFGIFQDYYTSHAPFAGSTNIAVIGTCAMGIMYLDCPLIMALIRLFPTYGRWSPIVGLLIMCLALAMSSFSQNVTQLIVTQGILYAVGGSICYSPCIVYLDEWFVRKKGFAYGIMWSGTGLGGVLLPLLLEYLLSKYGFETTLRLWASLVFVLTAPLAFFIKPRLPPSLTTHIKPFDLRFVMGRTFLLYQLANMVEAVGFFLPGIYLPTYARRVLGAANFPSALTLLVVNVASVFGCVAMGHLIDRVHVTTCILVSTAGATLGAFLLWGLSVNMPVLYFFCVVYGLFAGSFTSTWPGIMRAVAQQLGPGGSAGSGGVRDGAELRDSNTPSSVDPSMVFAFLAAGRGVGNVVSGPLSEVLIQGLPWQGNAVGGYGSGYGSLIVFTGVTALVGGASVLWRRIGLL